jgi:hypothetical protein
MIPPSCIDRDCQHLRQILHSATSTAAHVIPWVYSDISSCRACARASRGTAATARSCIDGRAHVWYVLLWGAAEQRPPTGNTHATRVVNRKPHTAHCIAECETVWMRVSPAHSHGHLAPSVTLVRIGLSSSSGRRLPPPHVKRSPQQMQPAWLVCTRPLSSRAAPATTHFWKSRLRWECSEPAALACSSSSATWCQK